MYYNQNTIPKVSRENDIVAIVKVSKEIYIFELVINYLLIYAKSAYLQS